MSYNNIDKMNIPESLKIYSDILNENKYSNKKAVWICEKHGNYIQSLHSHYLGRTGCKICLREKRSEKHKLRNNSILMQQLNLDESLLIDKNILDRLVTDRVNAVWICKEHGNYTQKIQYRLYGYVGCPECLYEDKYGYRTTYITDTDVSSRIDYKQCKIDDINPYKIIKSSDKRIPFKCTHGHTWYIQARSAIKTNAGCPICLRRKESRSDSIGKMRPDLLKFYSDNNEYSAYEIGINSLDSVEWICKNGHIFNSSVHTQNYIEYPADNVRCPYCSGLKRQTGINDFATFNKHIMDEWFKEKNDEIGLDPSKLPIYGNIKAYWKCRNNANHIWETTLTSRSEGSGCPFCFRARQTSTQEVAIKILLNKLGLDALNRCKIDKLEYDIKCDELMLLIEYHGMAWHERSVSGLDIRKRDTAKDNGYDFIIIREVRNVEYTTKIIKEDNINTILYNIGKNYETFNELLELIINIINRAYSKNYNIAINYSDIIKEAKEFIGRPNN